MRVAQIVRDAVLLPANDWLQLAENDGLNARERLNEVISGIMDAACYLHMVNYSIEDRKQFFMDAVSAIYDDCATRPMALPIKKETRQ